MNSYRIRYDAKGNYGFSYETIEARGIIHAFKLASDHLTAMKKVTKDRTIKIASVSQENQVNAK